MKGSSHLIAAVCLMILTTGCSQIMGALRPDLNDNPSYEAPTVGGRWSERGFLNESAPEGGDQYGAVGHSERAPASMSNGGSSENWIDPMREDANRRDLARDQENGDESAPVSFSNNPNVQPPVKRQYKNGNRATRADFIDESPNEGSLWASDGQTM